MRDPTDLSSDPAYHLALGRAIQVVRAELGLSRKELAGRAGISYTYLADIEKGRRRPSSQSLLQIARVFGMSPSALLERAEELLSRLPGLAAHEEEGALLLRWGLEPGVAAFELGAADAFALREGDVPAIPRRATSAPQEPRRSVDVPDALRRDAGPRPGPPASTEPTPGTVAGAPAAGGPSAPSPASPPSFPSPATTRGPSPDREFSLMRAAHAKESPAQPPEPVADVPLLAAQSPLPAAEARPPVAERPGPVSAERRWFGEALRRAREPDESRASARTPSPELGVHEAREELHDLIDELPSADVPILVQLVRRLLGRR